MDQKISLTLPKDLYKAVKVQSTLNDTNIKDFFVEALKDKLHATQQPNKETLAAIEESEHPELLSTYDSVDEMMKDILDE